MPASVGDDTPQTTTPDQDNKLKTLTKVVSNPYVSSILENAKGYYNYAKDKSSIVKYASNKVETNLEYGVKWVAPKIEPVLQTELYKKYEPLLRKADDFGAQQVDKIEKMTEKLTETYSQSKQMIEQKVTNITNDLKATTNALVEVSIHTFEEKIVPPVDNYLKGSVLSVPLNATLTITEQICDQILPKEQTETKEGKQEEKETTPTEKPQAETAGPVIRAGKLSRRIQREAFKKLSDLSLRPPEVRDAMKFSVDLIHYAATQIDTTTKFANQYVADSVNKTTTSLSNGVKVSKDKLKATLTVQQKNFQDAREKVHVMTDEALKALHIAIENLSKQVPQPVSQKAQETYSTIQNRSAALFAKLESNKELKAFTEVAKSSVAKLNETTHQLTQYAATASDALLHVQLVQSVTKSLTSVMDNLLSFGQKPKEQQTETKTEEVTPETSDESTEVTPEPTETEETTVTATPEETKEEEKVQQTEEAPQETTEDVDEDEDSQDDQ
eukprot:TRINITY_DN12071_c0_g1_i1.p1 TRINITY_DN12071_c0_g1~~TRINITY_DN12071_c0_g1_i1.p1  ORF type:complete len:500 (-),score=259.18 TRINITY_DN12071_c0_g1_i1:22-1521(-)